MEVVPTWSDLEPAAPYQSVRRASSQPQAQVPYSDSTVDPTAITSRVPPPKAGDMMPYETRQATGVKTRNWPLVAAIAATWTAIIVGAALGGGLGASLSDCRSDLQTLRTLSGNSSDSQSNTGLPTTTEPGGISSTTSSSGPAGTTNNDLIENYTATPATQIYNLDIDCGSLSASPQESGYGERFDVYCSSDAAPGPKIDKNGNGVMLADIGSTIAYSLADCLQACSGYNLQSQMFGWGNSCGSVIFWTILGGSYMSNCSYKNTTVHSTNLTAKDHTITAVKLG
ncbi:hypothetical protein GGR55DRAFT_5196 [Xylaria sp. FL0064]|nr:hypothetical protein GGR55DRAFT_5196 [Xylaria sp. FL0064]